MSSPNIFDLAVDVGLKRRAGLSEERRQLYRMLEYAGLLPDADEDGG